MDTIITDQQQARLAESRAEFRAALIEQRAEIKDYPERFAFTQARPEPDNRPRKRKAAQLDLFPA